MPETATLSSKFQISIPKAIRKAHAWEAGLIFAFIPKGAGVLLVPVPKLESLEGLARRRSLPGAQARDRRRHHLRDRPGTGCDAPDMRQAFRRPSGRHDH